MKTRLLLLIPIFISISVCAQKKDSIPAEDFKDDWAALSHYVKENLNVPAPAYGEQRVVFLGSSIIENWKKIVPAFFADRPYLDRGVSGQISPQLLLRFRQDVISLKPEVVIILAGSNDIAGNTGHVTNERIMDNISTMAELARLHHIRVILCQNLPVYEYPWRKELKPAVQLIALNKLISAYASAQGLTVVDYFTPLLGEHNGQRPELTLDGVHPNAAGYAIMAAATEEAIAKALKKPRP